MPCVRAWQLAVPQEKPPSKPKDVLLQYSNIIDIRQLALCDSFTASYERPWTGGSLPHPRLLKFFTFPDPDFAACCYDYGSRRTRFFRHRPTALGPMRRADITPPPPRSQLIPFGCRNRNLNLLLIVAAQRPAHARGEQSENKWSCPKL